MFYTLCFLSKYIFHVTIQPFGTIKSEQDPDPHLFGSLDPDPHFVIQLVPKQAVKVL